MQNDSIVITAKLNVDASEALILKDLETIENNIKGKPIQISATINPDSLKTIQSQISEFSKGLTINVGAVNAQSIQQSISEATKNQGVKVKLATEVDTKVVNADVDKIKKMFQLGIKGGTLTEFRQELKPLLQEFANDYKELDENKVQQSFSKILNFIDRTKNETIILDQALKETHETLRQLIQAEGAVNIDRVVKGDLMNIFNNSEKQVEEVLTGVFGKKGVGWAFTEMGKTTFSAWDTIAEQFKIECNNLAEGIANLYDILNQPLTKGNVFNVVSDLNDMLNSLASSLNLPTNLFEIMGNDVNMLFANVDEMSKLQTTVQGVDTSMQSLAIDAKQTDVAIEELLSDVNKYPDIAKISSGFSTSNADQLTYAKNQLNEYFTSVVQVEDKANRVKNAVADTEGELQRFYIQVEKGDKSIETLTYALNEQGTAYEFLSKTIREADNSTDFRRKGLDVQKDINTEKIDQFITKLKEANLYTGDLKTAADNLKTAIANVSDTNSMNKFLDDFDIAKAKFQALREESRLFSQQEKQEVATIKSAMSELDKIINNTQFGKQKNSLAGMIGDTNTLKDLKSSFEKTVSDAKAAKELYQELLNNLSKDASPTAIAKANTQLEQLKSEFDATTTSAKNLQTQLDAIKTFADASKNLLSIDQKSRSSNVTQAQMNQYAAEFEAYNHQITLMEQKLRLEGLYTEQIQRQRNAIIDNTNEIIRQRDAQEAQKNYTDEIINKYKELTEVNTRLMSGKAAETETADLTKRNDELKGYLVLLEQELNEKGLLQGEIKKVLDAEKERYDTTIKYAAEEKASAEATKQKAEETRKYNQELKETEKYINDAIAALQKFNNSAVAKKNSNNEFVQSQIGTNDDLINRLTNWQSSLANNNTAPNLQRIKAEMDAYTASVNNAVKSSEALNRELRDAAIDNKASAQIEKLKNQMELFAKTNVKAVNSLKQMRDGFTYLGKWQELITRLNSGTLDANGIQKLTQDFQAFKGECQSAGLTTSRFFTSMQSQLRMVVQRWISLYAIIGRITTAFNELKEVDKILTEIAKSSDVTRESLQSLGDAAFDMASKYGRLASDYLYGVQEFSRAGFRGDQLTALTEISLLAQSAGDIETDLANSYVIATNAAYEFEGSQEKLGEVLDRQNYVTNNYALNMTDLANSTKIAASQAAQSGVEIDEMTAALATMISTTQQGGEIAARAFRGKRALSTIALYRCEPIIA